MLQPLNNSFLSIGSVNYSLDNLFKSQHSDKLRKQYI